MSDTVFSQHDPSHRFAAPSGETVESPFDNRRRQIDRPADDPFDARQYWEYFGGTD